MDRAAVTQRVWELAEPLALAAGLELVDVQYRPEGGRVDPAPADRSARGRRHARRAGAHVARAGRRPRRARRRSRAATTSSARRPGSTDRWCGRSTSARAVGQRVRVRTREPIDGRRQFRGVLEAVDGDARHRCATRTPGSCRSPLAAIEKANIEFEFRRPARPGHAHA